MTSQNNDSVLELSVLHREFLARRISSLSPKPAVTVSPDTSVDDVIAWICVERSGAVLVVDSAESPSGIVTERDILTKWGRKIHAAAGDLAGLMTPNPQVLTTSASVARVIHYMANGGFRHLPVLSGAAELTKIISSKEVVDHIHHRLTAKLLQRDSDVELDSNVVDQFFTSNLSLLVPDKPLILPSHASVEDAIEMMRMYHQGAVVVANDKGLVGGIFTERDYLRKIVATNDDQKSSRLEVVMTPSPRTLLQSSSVAMAFSLFSQGGYRHIPIVDDSEVLIGMLSVRSFLNYLSKSIIRALEDYER